MAWPVPIPSAQAFPLWVPPREEAGLSLENQEPNIPWRHPVVPHCGYKGITVQSPEKVGSSRKGRKPRLSLGRVCLFELDAQGDCDTWTSLSYAGEQG